MTVIKKPLKSLVVEHQLNEFRIARLVHQLIKTGIPREQLAQTLGLSPRRVHILYHQWDNYITYKESRDDRRQRSAYGRGDPLGEIPDQGDQG